MVLIRLIEISPDGSVGELKSLGVLTANLLGNNRIQLNHTEGASEEGGDWKEDLTGLTSCLPHKKIRGV